MALLTPPGYVQGGTYTAKLDRVYNTTTRVVADVSTQLRARQGFYMGRAPVYANPSGWNVTLSACAGVVANTFASNAGDYELANDGTVQVTLAASSPTLNRQDIIGFQIKDNLFDASGLNTAVPAVIQGANSAGASVDPSLPFSFIPVVRALVPAGSTAPTLQTMVRYTTNDGGAIRIDSAAHRAELTPYAGMRIWRSDRLWHEFYTGSGWQVEGIAKGSSIADLTSAVTSPYMDQLGTVTNLNMVVRWDGLAWVGIMPMGGTSSAHRRDAQYAQSVLQTIPTNSVTALQFPTARYTSDDVVASGTGNDTFTLQRAGLWRVSASTRLGGGGGAERSLEVNNITDGVLIAATNSTGQSVANLVCGDEFRLTTTGKQFRVQVYQATGGNQDTSPSHTKVSFTWLRP